MYGVFLLNKLIKIKKQGYGSTLLKLAKRSKLKYV